MNSQSNSKIKKSIPYKYENAKNIEYKDKNLDDSDLSKTNNDIMINIENEAKKIKNNINQKDLKIFSKYENFSENELADLLEEKNQTLIKLSDEKDKSKDTLNQIVKNLNLAISKNADILCKEEADPETVIELNKILDSKKKALKVAKNLNQTFKIQYNTMINKISGNNNSKEKNKKNKNSNMDEKETHLIELKNENKNLELEIRKYKDDEISKQKELEIICEDKLYPAKIKMKSDENQNLLNQKYECFKKINFSLNSIKNLIQELNYLEKIYSEIGDKKENDKDKEKIEKQMNFWIDIIKNDLNGSEKEIISRIIKNQSQFINEIDKKVKSNKNEFDNNKIRSSSPNLNEKKFINLTIKKLKDVNNLEIDETENNKYNNKKIIINKGINSRLIYSQTTDRNISTKNKNIIPKGVFAKFSFLKQKPNTTESRSNKTNKNININNIKEELTEEKAKEENLENIIQKDYNDTTDADYRQLLDKKTQYLETNARLEENIKKIQRTNNKKYDSVYQVVQDNNNRLELLKARNELLTKEINNLNNVYQLTLEQEKIKFELKQKENEIKQKEKNIGNNTTVNKLDMTNVTEKAILNELKESNDIIPFKNKNKSGYAKENISYKNIQNDNETREEKLQKIKKKYKDMNDDNIDENIDEVDLNEEIKE